MGRRQKPCAKTSKFRQGHKKGVEPDLPNRGTGIPKGDKQAHANIAKYDVSIFTYLSLLLKITSFRFETSSANAFYINEAFAKVYNYNTIIDKDKQIFDNSDFSPNYFSLYRLYLLV